MRKLEKVDKIRDEIKNSASSNIIMLGHCCLHTFPLQIFGVESINKLQRLDLSHNNISEIPTSISCLISLKELWLQHNPLKYLPKEIQNLTKLELIDINSTCVSDVPTELANLEHLYEMDWRNTPLAPNLLLKHQIDENDVFGLRCLLVNLNTRKQLELQLFDYLFDEHYLMDADVVGIKSIIQLLVEVIFSIIAIFILLIGNS